MNIKCILANIVSYSPAAVLFVWAAVLSEQNHRMSKEMLIFFLCLTGVALAAAETVRFCKRKKFRRDRERRNALRRASPQ